MPVVSAFYGIMIYFYYKQHNPPHFHAKYNEFEALILISNLGIMEGELPGKALALVIEWASAHKDELMRDWDMARAGIPPEKIEPLK